VAAGVVAAGVASGVGSAGCGVSVRVSWAMGESSGSARGEGGAPSSDDMTGEASGGVLGLASERSGLGKSTSSASSSASGLSGTGDIMRGDTGTSIPSV